MMRWYRLMPRRTGTATASAATTAVLAATVAVFAATVSTPTAAADPTGGSGQQVVTQSQISQAQSAASALEQQLAQLDRQISLTHVRLVGIQDQLGQAVSAHLSTEQYGDALSQERQQLQQQAQQRVRDFYMSGGDLGLYASVLSGENPVDAYLQVQAVDTAVHGDFAASAATRTKLTGVRSAARQLHAEAMRRAQLSSAAEDLLAQLRELHRQQRAALAAADAQVKSLVRQYAAQQAATAAANAITNPANLHLSGRQDFVTPYAEAAVNAALSKLGDPYVWGAEGPDSFDCSGLVQWSYAQAGLYVPRVVPDQYAAFTPIPFADLHPGDVIVYGSTPTDLYHITMYIGDGLMVEAPHTGDVVKVVPVSLSDAYGAARPGA
jgi:peptidoglycan DL-endopeptidase CwlO